MHLSGHSGTLLAALPTGRLSQGTKDATIEWYEEVLRRSDEDEEEEAHCMGLIPVQRIQVLLSIHSPTVIRRLLIDLRSIATLCSRRCL